MRSYLFRPLLVLSLTLLAAACGGGEPGEAPAATGGEATPAAAQPAGTAVIQGTITFTGTAPEQQSLDVDRECLEGIDGPILSQNVVVNDNGTLRWVFVYIKEGLGSQTFAAPDTPVEIDQEHCRYVPHVFGIQTGQTLRIHNSDTFQHNIHALPETNRPFNYSTPMQGMTRDATFRSQEVMVPIKCDVHPWMQAYVGVLPHPYFSTSGPDGAFRIEGLPAGTYTVEAWHEEYGTQTQQVTVGDGETVTSDFSYSSGAS